MIADATFGPRAGRLRALRFTPRASIPLEAACIVANRIGDTLRELFGSACRLVVGEPAAISAGAWSLLARDAFLFLTRGRQTDVVLVLPRRDARRLVLHAFGESADDAALGDAACSTLELHAIDRIAARCAAAFDPLCAQRRDSASTVRPGEIPACVAYFDVRVHAPIPLTLGIGILRNLPEPAPERRVTAGALDTVPLELRAVFAEVLIETSALVALRAGDVLMLDTKVGAPASLNLGGRPLASGVAGVVASRAAFLVDTVTTGVLPQ
jgi:flagellar motor switch/type III secretory pathway protein FliN